MNPDHAQPPPPKRPCHPGDHSEPLYYSGNPKSPALSHTVVAVCPTTGARASTLVLPHATVLTPIFMPVGTQGTLKGVPSESVDALGCRIMLSNTYHLGLRPGEELLESVGGLHKLMSWPRNLLTDSGGFQMVSLLALADITEEGVTFQSPHDGTPSLLTPEKSMSIQNAIGADIMMALDDVVSSLVEGDRVREAMERTLRWIDRCIEGHKRPERQNLFGIVQGGLDSSLREICLKGLIERDLPGYAIGGLSGGESKDRFWPIVLQCTRALPPGKPRYLMGVGYPVDLVVCVALGVDMFDCVYPTRTARFGTALVPAGLMSVREKAFANDFSPVQEGCACSTCARYTRSYLHHLFAAGSQNAGILLSIHNVAYLLGIMGQMRSAIIANTFPAWVLNFMETVFPKRDHPKWVRDALQAVNITLPTEKD